jgi:hypothetical protein
VSRSVVRSTRKRVDLVQMTVTVLVKSSIFEMGIRSTRTTKRADLVWQG